MASVLRYKVFSALRNVSKSRSLMKHKSLTNVRFAAAAASPKNLLAKYQEMSTEECLALVEDKVNNIGRLSNSDIKTIFHAVRNRGDIKSHHVLLLIKCCGSMGIYEKPEVRAAYAEAMWNELKDSGVALDISHYNAYLKIKMENEENIDPFEYLEQIKEAKLVPNRVTYQLLITYYCEKGDLPGATKLLEIMKGKNYLLNENIFNSLILGHCIAGDVRGAEDVMNIMKEKNVLITAATYAMLLCGLSQSGNIEKMRSVMDENIKNNTDILGHKFFLIIYNLFLNGHNDYARELLEVMPEGNMRHFVTLQYRLLHKRLYEGYLQTLDFMQGDNLEAKMKLGLRYLGNKEDISNILEFKELVDKKGLNVNVMKNILFYSLLNKNVEKTMEILKYMHKSGEKVKKIYFEPLLIEAARKSNFDEIFQLVDTMIRVYGCEVSSSFISRNVCDYLIANERQLLYFIGGLTVQIPSARVHQAIMLSALRKGDLDTLTMLLENARINLMCFENALDLRTMYFTRSSGLSFLVSVLRTWMRTQNNRTEDIEKLINNVAIKIFRRCDKSAAMEFLNVVKKENLPISAEIVDIIEKSSNAESVVFPGEETMRDGSAEGSERVTGEQMPEDCDGESNEASMTQFMNLRRSENLSEMEKFFNEHEEFQTPFGFKNMVEVLKIKEEHDKVLEYLRRYYEKYAQEKHIAYRTFFLENEMFDRGMVEEAVALIDKRGRLPRSANKALMNVFAPIIERSNPDEIGKLFNVDNYAKENLDFITENMVNRGSVENLLKTLDLLDMGCIEKINFSRCLIPALYNEMKVECMDSLIEIIKKHSKLTKSASELTFLYACTGNIAKGRELLDLNPANALRWIRYISAIEEAKRRQLLENAIAISRGYHSSQKKQLFDHLILNYEQNSVDPDKALDLWLQLQEENIEPNERFLVNLAAILNKHGREVPFTPPERNASKLFVPNSFPTSIKQVFWGLASQGHTHNALAQLETLVLENKIQDFHINKIKSKNGKLNPEIQTLLNTVLNYIEWSKAYNRGNLVDYWKEVVDSEKSAEIEYSTVPCKFLMRLLVSHSMTAQFLSSKVILWAHLRNCPEYTALADYLEPEVMSHIKNHRILGSVVRALERESSSPKVKKILAFLLDRNVFSDYSKLQSRVETALNRPGYALKQANISDEKENEMNAENDLGVDTDIRAEIDVQDSEVPGEKLDSPESDEIRKKSESSPNI